MKNAILILPLLLAFSCSGGKTEVFFDGLKDGDTVKSPLTIKFGVSGMELVPAGEKGDCKTCGHHHILVDKDVIPMGKAIPNDPKNGFYHYGKAQTEGTIELTPGKHKLTMQFADAAHVSYGMAMAKTITVTVEK